MRDQHAPHDDFVERLESKIGREVRRRNALADSRSWIPRPQLKTVIGMAALVLVSMAIGGAVVAAAYQAQNNEQREALSSSYERRAELAKRRIVLSEQELMSAEQRVATGLASMEPVLEARVKLAEAQSSLKVIELQLVEIRLTSREPLAEVSAPLVSGRDFVTERWKIELSVPTAALEFEKVRLRTAEQRVDLGVADPADVEISRARVLEMESGIERFQRKIDIRQRFLKSEIDAPMADLLVLESNAELGRKALAPKIEVARKSLARVNLKFQTGTATLVERGEAQLRVLQLETDLTQLDVELALVRRQILQRRVK